MATLTGQTPANTYKDLMQVSNSNSGIDATLRDISDGEGTASGVQISTTGFRIKSGTTFDAASGGLFDWGTESFKVDTIDESTPAAGVTIDGVLLKDGGAVLSGVLSIDDTTESTSTTTGSLHTDGGLGVAKSVVIGNFLTTPNSGVLTIAADAITPTGSLHSVAVSGGGAADLTTVNGGTIGVHLILRGTGGDTITVKEGGGLRLAGNADFVMANSDTLLLLMGLSSGNWAELSRSSN